MHVPAIHSGWQPQAFQPAAQSWVWELQGNSMVLFPCSHIFKKMHAPFLCILRGTLAYSNEWAAVHEQTRGRTARANLNQASIHVDYYELYYFRQQILGDPFYSYQ